MALRLTYSALRRVAATRVAPLTLPCCTSSSLLPFIRRFSSAAASTGSLPLNRVIRFRDDGGDEHWGVFDVSDPTESTARIVRSEGGKRVIGNDSVHIMELLPPVDPLNVFCIGLNYADHAREVKMEPPKFPVVFTKAISALTGHNCPILLPKVARDEVDYEAELAVVIGRPCKDVPAEEALQYVLGYTIANDVTARRWQGKKGGGQWARSKSFDSFLPLGPYLVPASEVPDPQALRIRTWVNDNCVQDGSTGDMIHSVAQLIAFLSQDTTLLPGTVILTGTPAGVGYVKERYLRAGDVVRIEIERLGVLRNIVVEEL